MTGPRAGVDPDLVATLEQLLGVALAYRRARQQQADGIRRGDMRLYDTAKHEAAEQRSVINLRAEKLRYDAAALLFVLETAATLRALTKRKPSWQDVERAVVRDAALQADRTAALRDEATIARHVAVAAIKAADAASAAVALFARAA
jgi:hypothetical protein